MHDHWEIWDIYKALLALAAGMILGLEREMKDKVAGLKTITIICLGAALFGILSDRLQALGNPNHIAAYVVSGVGFIGAGAIFKDGFTISGLTTAGIIWLAAAVGLSIGFGEFYLAGTFMIASMFIIFSTPFINKLVRTKKITRQLEIVLTKDNMQAKESIIKGLRQGCSFVDEKKMVLKDHNIIIQVEIVLNEHREQWVQDYLLKHELVKGFSL